MAWRLLFQHRASPSSSPPPPKRSKHSACPPSPHRPVVSVVTSISTSFDLRSATQLPLLGVTLAELAARLLEDRPRTPEYMRAEYLDHVMSPWNFDFSSNIALPSRALCDLVADTPIDPDGDIIQAIIHAGGTCDCVELHALLTPSPVQAINDPDGA